MRNPCTSRGSWTWVIFASSPVSLEHLAALAGRGLFIVTFDRRFHEGDFANVDCVTVYNVHGSAMATRHLLDLGHRRIGFLSGPIETESRNDRYDGYRRALATADIAPRRNWLWEGPGDGGQDFGDAWRGPPGPGRRAGTAPADPSRSPLSSPSTTCTRSARTRQCDPRG